MTYSLVVTYDDCEFTMSQESLEFYLANQPKWEDSDGQQQFQSKQVLHQRVGGYRIEYPKNDT